VPATIDQGPTTDQGFLHSSTTVTTATAITVTTATAITVTTATAITVTTNTTANGGLFDRPTNCQV